MTSTCALGSLTLGAELEIDAPPKKCGGFVRILISYLVEAQVLHFTKFSLKFVATVSMFLWLCGSALTAHAGSNDIVLYASKATVRAGTWGVIADRTAAGGFVISNPNLGVPKIKIPLAKPANYFELTFPAYGGQPYHLWIRAKSFQNSTSNDSVFFQFSDSVTANGSAIDRISTTSGAAVVLQACFGAPEQGWGWADNGWCKLGSSIRFQNTGMHTLRVQVREDGLSIDQIVLSPQTYSSTAPGKRINDTTILAANAPPVTGGPTVTIAASATSGAAPLAVTFNANISNGSGSVTAYHWDFGDGQTSSVARPSHVYQVAGTFNPWVQITDTAGGKASASAQISVSGKSPGVNFRVAEANISYGGHGTDNIINLPRTVSWLVKMNPDVAALVEVLGGSNDPALLVSLLHQQTGLNWYYSYVPKFSGCNEGVMIVSKWPITSTSQLFLSFQRSVTQATLNVNGKSVNFFSAGFEARKSASYIRQLQAAELLTFAARFSEPRIIAGDFNAQDGTAEMDLMEQFYDDGWTAAVNRNTAVAYTDNPPDLTTRTRRSRIDHVLISKNATTVSLSGGQVPDTRNLAVKPVILIGTLDDKGVRPSDHNFMSISLVVH